LHRPLIRIVANMKKNNREKIDDIKCIYVWNCFLCPNRFRQLFGDSKWRVRSSDTNIASETFPTQVPWQDARRRCQGCRQIYLIFFSYFNMRMVPQMVIFHIKGCHQIFVRTCECHEPQKVAKGCYIHSLTCLKSTLLGLMI
jgi:hypothetical protein